MFRTRRLAFGQFCLICANLYTVCVCVCVYSILHSVSEESNVIPFVSSDIFCISAGAYQFVSKLHVLIIFTASGEGFFITV